MGRHRYYKIFVNGEKDHSTEEYTAKLIDKYEIAFNRFTNFHKKD